MNAVPFTLLHSGAPARSTRQPASWAPPPPSTTTSARLLADFASLLILSPVEAGAGKADELDGELLDCCAEAVAADQAAERCMDGMDCLSPADPAYGIALASAAPFLAAYEDAVAWAARTPARTPEGLRCKATLLLHVLAAGCEGEALAASLARDVAGRGAG